MKTLKLNTVICIIFGFLLVTAISCRGNDDGGGTTSVAAGKCSVSMNYTGNASGSFSNDINLSATVNMQGMIVMTAVRLINTSTTESFSISLPANIKTGSYTISQLIESMGTFTYISNSSDTNNNSYVAGAEGDNNFTVNITNVTTGKVEGTFKGDMFNINGKKINVNGQFQAAY